MTGVEFLEGTRISAPLLINVWKGGEILKKAL
jgi:hypothetical protein